MLYTICNFCFPKVNSYHLFKGVNMLQESHVKFSNFLLSLSDAMDIAIPRIASHQMRTAFIAWKLALAAGLSEDKVENIYLAALLHDIGALSLEEKVQLHAGFEDVKPETHCILGEALFELSPLLKPASTIVRHHHRSWEDWNEPIGLDHVTGSQILYLADEIERSILRKTYILHQIDKLNAKIAALADSQIHADIVSLFFQLSKYEDFWLDLTSPRLYSLLLHFGPFRKIEIERNNISSIASVFRHIVDFKSRFTATHSTGVAECAVILAKSLGFTDAEVDDMRVAGLFHDLGKLAVPNSILEKPGKLTKDEFNVIKQHTYFTYTVLTTIGGLGHIAEWAAFHHEKFDGSGYPFHIKADRINLGARIVAVADIFTALSEKRLYRKDLQKNQIKDILKNQIVNNSLDARIVNIILYDYEEISAKVKSRQEESIELFEMKFSKIKNKRF